MGLEQLVKVEMEQCALAGPSASALSGSKRSLVA